MLWNDAAPMQSIGLPSGRPGPPLYWRRLEVRERLDERLPGDLRLDLAADRADAGLDRLDDRSSPPPLSRPVLEEESAGLLRRGDGDDGLAVAEPKRMDEGAIHGAGSTAKWSYRKVTPLPAGSPAGLASSFSIFAALRVRLFEKGSGQPLDIDR